VPKPRRDHLTIPNRAGIIALLTEASVKMNETLCRPFYAEYAWAFDLLIDRPVEKECGVIAAWLAGREILPGAGVLDAGCGTGR
jgi:hypothetical protein